jgi:hypothetical protein
MKRKKKIFSLSLSFLYTPRAPNKHAKRNFLSLSISLSLSLSLSLPFTTLREKKTEKHTHTHKPRKKLLALPFSRKKTTLPLSGFSL